VWNAELIGHAHRFFFGRHRRLRDQRDVRALRDQVAHQIVDVTFEAADAVQGMDGAGEEGNAKLPIRHVRVDSARRRRRPTESLSSDPDTAP
jgi:hypothetical protein